MEGTATWPETVKVRDKRAEPTTEAIDAIGSPEAKVVLAAIIAKIMVTWLETVKQVAVSTIQRGRKAATYVTNPDTSPVTALSRIKVSG